MTFTRQDMSFVHYRWDKDEEPAATLFTGEPSRREFNSFNGNQVLFLINCYATVAGSISLTQARFIESKIAHQLPEGLKSERAVFNWVVQELLAEK